MQHAGHVRMHALHNLKAILLSRRRLMYWSLLTMSPGADWDEKSYRAKFVRAPVLQGPRGVCNQRASARAKFFDISLRVAYFTLHFRAF
jgi:hypothetical protein